MCMTYFIRRLQGRMSPRRLSTVAIFGAAQVQEGTLGGLYSGSHIPWKAFWGGGRFGALVLIFLTSLLLCGICLRRNVEINSHFHESGVMHSLS